MSAEDPVDRKIALDSLNSRVHITVMDKEVVDAKVVKDQFAGGELSDQSPAGSGGIGSDK